MEYILAIFSIIFLNLLRINFMVAQGNTLSGVTDYCDVVGGKIWYIIYGAEKSGTPLVCIHGGPGATHDYLLTINELDGDRPVVFYDQLGCGRSDKPDNDSLWTVERYTKELGTLIKHLGYTEVFLLGHSWGTILATELYFTKSVKVRGMILSGACISPDLFVKGARSYLSALPDNYRKVISNCEKIKDFNNASYTEAMNYYYNLHLCRTTPWHPLLLESLNNINSKIYTYMWGPSEFTATGTLLNHNRINDLQKISVPVLYTSGEYDEATPEITKMLSDLTPDSKIVVFKDASHNHHLEKTEEYNYIVKSFIEKTETDKDTR
ncbi:MAG: proline iminopeptidase-family hydrolase [Ignavibacteriae bacterium]|nr:proline iminopeptidase-family hydrolase [Ignavibacteriota bacterium]